jgi:hypothetical protein
MLQSLLISVAIAVGGMVDLGIPGTLPAAALQDSGSGPAIVHIVSRDQTLTIRSGASELRYSVTSSDGKILVANVSAQDLANSHPELYRQYHQFIAVQADGTDAEAGAGIGLSADLN